MRIRPILVLIVCAAASIALAQETPVPLPTPLGAAPIATLPPSPDATLEILPPAPLPTTLGLEQIAALPILAAARADMELLATESIGTAQRPIGWTGATDPADPDLPIKVRLDLELLAGSLNGDARPPGWFGVVASVPIGIARDIRHDLELLADQVIGTSGIRPAGWQGDNPIFRCGRATQAILTMLEADNLTILVDFSQADYCLTAEIDAAIYVERNVLQPLRAGALNVDSETTYPFNADTPFIVAFLDRDARQKIGVLPVGTGFEALGRSTVGFSNMTLIAGTGFRLYVDWTTTPLTGDQFESLPDFDSVGGEIVCDAAWCGVNVE
ncbi:MAG: hypothetical protein SGJ24_01995 [Chloroflexota bacterium]|nr:hypothetical protein [Chloroflexota bacterium]